MKPNDIEPDAITRLQEARRRMSELAHRSCDCDWNDEASQRDHPCDSCTAQRAIDEIDKVLMPPLEGLHPNRMKNYPEWIYVERFRKECERVGHVNGGFGLLELLLQPEGASGVPPVSRRDAAVATTIIQWLGTNCGRCFVEAAERKIKNANAERRSFLLDGLTYDPDIVAEEETELGRVASGIARTYISADKYPTVVKNLQRSIIAAVKAFQRKQVEQALAATTH